MTPKRAENIIGFPVFVEKLLYAKHGYHAWTQIEGDQKCNVVAATSREALRMLVDATYKRRREMVMERAKRRCENCNRLAPLEVHHIVFRSHGRDDRIENLEALCNECHGGIHGSWPRSRKTE